MTDTRTSAVTETPLLPCPFCGNELYRSPRTHNPKAYCVTEDCYGKRMSVVNLDDPIILAMWNRRSGAPAQCAPSTSEGLADFVRRCQAYLDDAPGSGGHSDAAGSSAYELIAEAIEHCAVTSTLQNDVEKTGGGAS